MVPLVCAFMADSLLIRLVQLVNALEAIWVTSDKGAFTKERENVFQLVLRGEFVDFSQELRNRDAGKRILDSVVEMVSD